MTDTVEDNKFRSRRWMLANKIMNWSNAVAFIVLFIGTLVKGADITSIVNGVLLFLGSVYSLTYGVYGANRAVEQWSKK